MKSTMRFVEPGLAVVVVTFFGLMTASNAGVGVRAAPTGQVDDARAALCLGGACTVTGGSPNCGAFAHTCTLGGCTATTPVCTFNGSQCVMIGTLSLPSTYPCAKVTQSGTCQAYLQHECVLEKYGPTGYFSCNNGTYYCNQSSYCGELLYLPSQPPPNG